MFNAQNGELTFDRPAVCIGPSLRRSEFEDAAWAQGAAGMVFNGPWASWKLKGQYWSLELPFTVIVYFEGERLAMLDFCNADPQFGTSWEDYSEEKERRRKQSHDGWLNKSLGRHRSFPWGEVTSGDGRDPHGGGASSIVVRYR
jgi:hypothetical protein